MLVCVVMYSITAGNFVLGRFGHHGKVVAYVLHTCHGGTIMKKSTVSVCVRGWMMYQRAQLSRNICIPQNY